MKKKLFLPFLVIIFTVFTSQSFAGSGLMSINGQDTQNSNAKIPTVDEIADLLFHNKPIPGVVYYKECDINCYTKNIAVFTAVGRKGIYDNLNAINKSVGGKLLSNKSTGEILQFDETRKQNAEKLLRTYGKIKYINFGTTTGKLLGVENDLKGGSAWVTHEDLSGYYLTLDLTADNLDEHVMAKANCCNPNEIALVPSLVNGKNLQASSNTKTNAGDADPNLEAVLAHQSKNNGNNTKEVITTADGKTIINLTVNANPVAYAGGSNAIAYSTGGAPGANGNTGGNGTIQDKYKSATNVESYTYFGPKPTNNNLSAQQGNSNQTQTQSQSGGNQGIACNTCPNANNGAWNKNDVAYIQQQSSNQTALQSRMVEQNDKMIKQNRVGNAGIWTGVGIQAGHAIYDVIADVKGPNGRWVQQQYGFGQFGQNQNATLIDPFMGQ
jgi:hypothetical protein